jgi:hypothetical protein
MIKGYYKVCKKKKTLSLIATKFQIGKLKLSLSKRNNFGKHRFLIFNGKFICH